MALAGLLGVLAVASSTPDPAVAQSAGSGEVTTTAYGTNAISGGAFCWRGYAFQVTSPTRVTHLIGGGTKAFSATEEFRGALYSANVDSDGDPTSPKAILGEVLFEGATVNQAVELPSSVDLATDTWYYLAQGRLKGTVLHWYVASLRVPDLIAGSARIADWLPNSGSTGTAFYWDCDVPASGLLNDPPTDNSSKPAIGFRYESGAVLATVSTLDNPLGVALTDKGGAPTTFSVQYSTNSDLSGSELFQIEPLYDGAVPLNQAPTVTTDTGASTVTFTYPGGRSFSLNLPGSDTRYYWRAVAQNDAGRSEGPIKDFLLPATGLELVGVSQTATPGPTEDPQEGPLSVAVEQASELAGTESVLVRGSTPVPVTTTISSAAGPRGGLVIEDADRALGVTVTTSAGVSETAGVIVPTGGEVICEICAQLAAGSVVEAWVYSTPRLAAAVRVEVDAEEGTCPLLRIPTGTPLDGGDAIEPGAHTLQLRMYTDDGFEVLAFPITVGGPVPTNVPSGEGPAAPHGLLGAVAVLGLLGVAIGLRRRLATAVEAR